MDIYARILALDPGSSHVGVAVYNATAGIVALPSIMWTDKYDLINRIETLISEYEITEVLVGDMGKKTLEVPFGEMCKRLSKNKNIMVHVVPEKFSTHQAELYHGSHSDAAGEILNDFITTSKYKL